LVGKRIGQLNEEEGGYASTQSSPGYGGGLRAPSRANEFGGTTGQSASFNSYLSTARERERERELERERENRAYFGNGIPDRRLGSISGQGGLGGDVGLTRRDTVAGDRIGGDRLGGGYLEKALQGRLDTNGVAARLRSGSLVGLRDSGRRGF